MKGGNKDEKPMVDVKLSLEKLITATSSDARPQNVEIALPEEFSSSTFSSFFSCPEPHPRRSCPIRRSGRFMAIWGAVSNNSGDELTILLAAHSKSDEDRGDGRIIAREVVFHKAANGRWTLKAGRVVYQVS